MIRRDVGGDEFRAGVKVEFFESWEAFLTVKNRVFRATPRGGGSRSSPSSHLVNLLPELFLGGTLHRIVYTTGSKCMTDGKEGIHPIRRFIDLKNEENWSIAQPS